MQKRVILMLVSFGLIFLYAYFFEIFFSENFIWISVILAYIVFFLAYDFSIRRKEFKERVFVKDRKDIRIDFWK